MEKLPAADEDEHGIAVLERVTAELRILCREAAAGTMPVASAATGALFAHRVEELSRAVEHLQVVAAGRLEHVRSEAEAAGHTLSWVNPDGERQQEYRNTSEYLRASLRIGRTEAARRLKLAGTVLPTVSITGQSIEPVHEQLAEAMANGEVSSRAATTVTMALRKARPLASPGTLTKMEASLTATAAEQDTDFLAIVSARWMNHIDQDGVEPSEEVLRHHQGVFLRARKAGLHHLEIFATDDQYEHLATAINTAANPRARGCGTDDPDAADPAEPAAAVAGRGAPGEGAAAADLHRRSRPQKLLDGLVAACKAALAAGGLPASGGHRPQVMAVIDYQELLRGLEDAGGYGDGGTGDGDSAVGTGSFVFAGPVSAANIRQLACDAQIIPVVLSSDGRILDVGQEQRLFPSYMRKALVARDGGCAFPGCCIPSAWCEAHHIDYWSKGGATATDSGVLLCGFHHHLIHKERWRITVQNGVPWFVPPAYIDSHRKPLRNHFFDRRPYMPEYEQPRLPLFHQAS